MSQQSNKLGSAQQLHLNSSTSAQQFTLELSSAVTRVASVLYTHTYTSVPHLGIGYVENLLGCQALLLLQIAIASSSELVSFIAWTASAVAAS